MWPQTRNQLSCLKVDYRIPSEHAAPLWELIAVNTRVYICSHVGFAVYAEYDEELGKIQKAKRNVQGFLTANHIPTICNSERQTMAVVSTTFCQQEGWQPRVGALLSSRGHQGKRLVLP